MKLAIMQPYFFPYIGYFQLIRAVDKFVFYDDVNFIKNGWINRNRILLNNQAIYITVQLKGASSFKQINFVEFTDNREKLKKTIEQAYKKAPYFNSVWAVINDSLDFKTSLISELAIHSVVQVSKYLNLDTIFETSSIHYPETKSLKKAERLKEICRINGASGYINPIGGTELYGKEEFTTLGIDLCFINYKDIKYVQGKNEFVPSLSIIDVMMFNSPEEINRMLNQYELI
jgi:WbqC-like protein family.